MQVSIGEAQKLTSPNPFALVGTCDSQGNQNFMALSWWTYASNRPATLVICTSDHGYSGKLIRASGAFTLNIVGKDISETAFACGCSSGANVDKVAKYDIPVVASEKIAPMCVKGSRVSFECELVNQLQIGDHTLYVGAIVDIHADPSVAQVYAFEGYKNLGVVF